MVDPGTAKGACAFCVVMYANVLFGLCAPPFVHSAPPCLPLYPASPFRDPGYTTGEKWIKTYSENALFRNGSSFECHDLQTKVGFEKVTMGVELKAITHYW